MNKTILLISLVALLLPFQVRAADTGRVSEIFACTFKEGKDWEDFNRINDKFAEMLDKIGGDANNFNAFVWQPYRGSVEFTYLWAAYYDNLQALADSWQAITDAGMDEEVNELWGELETCISGITTAELIYDSPDHPAARRDPEAKGMLESYRCRLQPGKSLDDVASAVTIWQQHVNAVGLPFDVYMRTPIVSGSDYTHSYFVTHADASAYGANMSAWRTHPDTAAIDAMLSEVQVCQTALWQSWQVQSAE
jgi:hypothetical protein